MSLNTPLELPCGVTLSNRIAKAALSEQLAHRGRPTSGLRRLYGAWAAGGAGMLLTGNVMVDRRFLESHMNVIIDDESEPARFAAWAAEGSSETTALWMQINHPGRQTPRHIHATPVAPSAVEPVRLFRKAGAFGRPRALDAGEISEIVERFARAASFAKAAGFQGVQIHGAHGYLASQFLSPLTNQRGDRWGGTLTNRYRFLEAVIGAVRDAVGSGFPVSVKLNSADFQRGGFDEAESLQVVQWLARDSVDLIEISGGSYESAAMFDMADSTRRREAYFLEFAREARSQVDTPLMVTGGFRKRSVMEEALAGGALDVIGMGRPFTNNPNVARDLIEGRVDRADEAIESIPIHRVRTTSSAMMSVVQMAMLSKGMNPRPKYGAPHALALLGWGLLKTARGN